MSHCITVNRDTPYLWPLSVDEWQPIDCLALFVVKVFELCEQTRQHADRDSSAHRPAAPLGLLGACRTWSIESENRPRRAQFLPDLQPNSRAIGQKDGEKWAAAVDLQPTISKSDRLLGAWAAEGASAATREKTVHRGAPNGADSSAISLLVSPRCPRFSHVSLRRLLPPTLLVYGFADGAHPSRKIEQRALERHSGQQQEHKVETARRRISMRRLDKALGEWSLVTMAMNTQRMHLLRAA